MASRPRFSLAAILAACGGGGGLAPSDAPPLARDAMSAGDAFSGACNPVHQFGCVTGQQCVLIVPTADERLPAAFCDSPPGALPLGAGCALDAVGADRCAPSLACRAGVCAQICDGSVACLQGFCPEVEVPAYPVCTLGCEPLGQDCPVGSACYLRVNAPLDQVAGCLPAGDRQVGAPCSRANDCAGGLTCGGASVGCRPLCDLSDPMACAAGETCVSLDGVHGICLI